MINEIFSSFQGEGLNTGLATTFVRLAGCNIRCRWCDTPYALDPGDGEDMEIDGIIKIVGELRNEIICITGGEPMYQSDVHLLISDLVERGYKINLETNGTIYLGNIVDRFPQVFISMDVKTPSSGEEGSIDVKNVDILRDTDQIKFIIKDRIDLDYSMNFIEDHPVGCSIIFTPCSNEKGDSLSEWMKEYLDNYRQSGREDLRSMAGRIRLMIQSHRVIWGDRKGV